MKASDGGGDGGGGHAASTYRTLRTHRSTGTLSEINVTPLVDVCLVLLIIFMVMVPKALPEISVRVPPDRANPETPQTEESLVVQVDEQ